jgi:hypothetical protein
MSTICFTLTGFSHLYRSLLRFCRMSGHEAKELVYYLNTANLDSLRYAMPDFLLSEATPLEFDRCMNRSVRPYRTEVQFYKAMEALNRNINREAITADQRGALLKMRCIMREVESAFYKCFEMDISDKRTVYAACAGQLMPEPNEPSVCLMGDWLALTSA